MLLDSGVISDPFVAAVNDYINTQGHHGHGDDMQCFAMQETSHDLDVVLYLPDPDNMLADERDALLSGVENLVRCAFRENTDYDVKKTWPYGRFSFSNLGRRSTGRLRRWIQSLSLRDIVSELNVPRLANLTVSIEHD